MTEQANPGYKHLTLGFEFPEQTYKLEPDTVSDYLKAVGESNDIFRTEGLVPPLALAAYAMSALSAGIALPPGTIHVSQELEISGLVHVGDTITCHSKVGRRLDRGGLHLMATDFTVLNQSQEKVLGGRVGFVLPDNATPSL